MHYDYQQERNRARSRVEDAYQDFIQTMVDYTTIIVIHQNVICYFLQKLKPCNTYPLVYSIQNVE